jgi:hypothetical protein
MKCYLVLRAKYRLKKRLFLEMQKLKTKFQLQGLITPYAVVAILFIILFQVYWLHTTYLNEEKIIIDQAQNILKEQF